MANTVAMLLLAAVMGKPIGEPGSWLTTSDYPKSEVNRAISGVTSFQLVIDKNGSPEDCTIMQTSGSEALDATACALLKVRARFTPARDSDGHKVGFIYNSKVVWKLPGDASVRMPSAPQILTVTVDQDERGVVEKCLVVVRPEGLSDTATTPCIAYPNGHQLRTMTDANGKPAKVRITITQSVSYSPR